MRKDIDKIPIFEGYKSLVPAPQGRTMEYEWKGEDQKAYIPWPDQWRRKWMELRDPEDGHILSDDEIQVLLNAINHGYNEAAFMGTEQFIKYLTLRQQIAPTLYGNFQGDVSTVRFFGRSGEMIDGQQLVRSNRENILADIRALNEKENMGNIKIPDTDVELINYSPCPHCGHVHSFSDIFNYYQNPVPDPAYADMQDQMEQDTRVLCVECGTYFLPALIIVDNGTPKDECQMICRRQTIASTVSYMKTSYKVEVLYNNKNNIIRSPDQKRAAWRNDVDAKRLKTNKTLFANFLSYTPAPQIFNFITRRNLVMEEPLYGEWLRPENVQYVDF